VIPVTKVIVWRFWKNGMVTRRFIELLTITRIFVVFCANPSRKNPAKKGQIPGEKFLAKRKIIQ